MTTSPPSHASTMRRLPQGIAMPSKGWLSDARMGVRRLCPCQCVSPAYTGKLPTSPLANSASCSPRCANPNSRMDAVGSVKYAVNAVSTVALTVSVRSGSAILATVIDTRGAPVIGDSPKECTLPLIMLGFQSRTRGRKSHAMHGTVADAL